MYKVEFWIDDNNCLQALKEYISIKFEIDADIDFDRLSFEIERTDLKPITNHLKKYIKNNFECDFDFDYEFIEDKINSGFETINPYSEFGVNELYFY